MKKTQYYIRTVPDDELIELWKVPGIFARCIAFKRDRGWWLQLGSDTRFTIREIAKWRDQMKEISEEEAVMILFEARPFSAARRYQV